MLTPQELMKPMFAGMGVSLVVAFVLAAVRDSLGFHESIAANCVIGLICGIVLCVTAFYVYINDDADEVAP